ncbi:MAG: alpha/beta fold hydrolase [Geminicoccaceae bacterium]
MSTASKLRSAIAIALTVFAALLLARPAWANAVPRFEPIDCWSYVPPDAHARCGFLVVPESRHTATGKTIRVAVAIVPAARKGSSREPLLYLAGGPGGVPILQVAMYTALGFNADRDLILVNQRGTFLSEPALVCPSIDEHFLRVLGLRFDSDAARRSMLGAARTCRRELLARDIDIAAFNTTENASDLADLRRVLGYRQWNVYGVSYGTDLALALLRLDPKGVRSLVLDSTVPPNLVTFAAFWPNAAEGFDAFFRACARQPACRAQHPNLEQRFTRLVDAGAAAGRRDRRGRAGLAGSRGDRRRRARELARQHELRHAALRPGAGLDRRAAARPAAGDRGFAALPGGPARLHRLRLGVRRAVQRMGAADHQGRGAGVGTPRLPRLSAASSPSRRSSPGSPTSAACGTCHRRRRARGGSCAATCRPCSSPAASTRSRRRAGPGPPPGT